MSKQVEIALARPVFDPMKQIVREHSWWADRLVSAVLTCNIGME